jgi:uracil-DNA glycosylase
VSQTALGALAQLHTEIAACTKCNEAGYFAETSALVVSQPNLPSPLRAERPFGRGAGGGVKMMLVGQAPASPLRSKGKPFSGQAGRVLFSWLARAGFSEDDFRARCYFTAITKCYPGPAKPPISPPTPKGEFGRHSLLGAGGRGDRVPTAAERALCLPYLLRELALIQPRLIITVGRISMAYFLSNKMDFTQAIGQRFERDGRIILPLPHPSGVSRWSNDPRNKERLARALAQLGDITHSLE